ncbi:hypothetical protein [Cupriavidus sp. CuC1]|uniref:hypothetical protein n=1 Tax=Cupriavidus sp. CuC1 TaxID=3373131 RepID=UPI0037D83EE6
MAEPNGRRHWWPDFSRFGARLSVAENPSVGRNFLKLSILDRARFAQESGIVQDDDLLRIMRANGFTYFPSEVRSRADRACDAGVGQGMPIAAVERAVNEEKSRLYFYAQTFKVSLKSLNRIIPAFVETDLREFVLAEIKHLDHEYISGKDARSFIQRMQTIDGAEHGVFYTTHRDRETVRTVAAATVSANVVLNYADLPRKTSRRLFSSAGPAAGFAAFSSFLAMEDVLHVATLGLDGYPLKAPRLSALAIAYPTYAAAVVANGGDTYGVEREKWPWGLPLGFDVPEKRLLVLRDGRFLEYNPRRLPDPEAELANAQTCWTLMQYANMSRAR